MNRKTEVKTTFVVIEHVVVMWVPPCFTRTSRSAGSLFKRSGVTALHGWSRPNCFRIGFTRYRHFRGCSSTAARVQRNTSIRSASFRRAMLQQNNAAAYKLVVRLRRFEPAPAVGAEHRAYDRRADEVYRRRLSGDRVRHRRCCRDRSHMDEAPAEILSERQPPQYSVSLPVAQGNGSRYQCRLIFARSLTSPAASGSTVLMHGSTCPKDQPIAATKGNGASKKSGASKEVAQCGGGTRPFGYSLR